MDNEERNIESPEESEKPQKLSRAERYRNVGRSYSLNRPPSVIRAEQLKKREQPKKKVSVSGNSAKSIKRPDVQPAPVVMPSVPKKKKTTPSFKNAGVFVLGFICCGLCIGLASWFLLSRAPGSDELIAMEETENSSQQLPVTNSQQSALSSSGNIYYRDDILWTGAQGYLLGDYIALQDTTLRSEPLNTASSTGSMVQYEVITIEEIQEGLGGSIWGKNSIGDWVCLSDSSGIYLYGSGQYHTESDTVVYNENHISTDLIEQGEDFFVERVVLNDEALWGVLDEGHLVRLDESDLSRNVSL